MAITIAVPPAYASSVRSISNIARQTKGWRYTGEKRDLRLDLLRGFAALTMIIDHIGGKDSWLYAISGGDRFFVSAAEGFVFISGLVMGIVYVGVLARQGLRAALVKGAKRVVTLYGLTVGLSLIFAGISSQLNLPWAPHIAANGFSDFVIGIVTLHSTYYLTDVLLLYTLVVAAALPMLALLWRGYGWLVLAMSWALWGAWQLWPDSVQLPWAITGDSMFHFSAWQVLFVTGLVIGYYRKSIEARLARLFRARARVASAVQGALLVLCAMVVGGSISIYTWLQSHPVSAGVVAQLDQLFGKADVRIGRLALFACLFVFAFLLTTLVWTPIKKLLGRLLLPMGQDALTVYTLHLFVIALLVEIGATLLAGATDSLVANTLMQAAGIAIIWAAIMAKAPAKAFLKRVLSSERRVPSSMATYLYRLQSVIHSTLDARYSALGAQHSALAGSRSVRLGFIGAALTIVVLVSAAGPALAKALKNSSHSAASSGVGTLAVPSATAFAVPIGEVGVYGSSEGATSVSGMSMLFSGTAVPSTGAPSATPTPIVLPSYVQQRTFLSASLNRTMPYYVYLPPGYDSNPGVRYPVLYMLHGMSGSNSEWLGYGLMGRARDMMAAGQISQFIIVLPQGDQGYWVDHADDGPLWGSYVAHDMVKEIDANFRTLADRQHRAVGGLSMGGYGALQLAINYPDVFGVAGADSPSLHTFASAPPFFDNEAYFDAHDPMHLFALHSEVARTLKLYIDVGQQDPWLPVVYSFHQLLQDQGIPHEWHAFEGGHEGTYWSTHAPDYLQFYSATLGSGVSQPTPTATPTSTPAGSIGTHNPEPVRDCSGRQTGCPE